MILWIGHNNGANLLITCEPDLPTLYWPLRSDYLPLIAHDFSGHSTYFSSSFIGRLIRRTFVLAVSSSWKSLPDNVGASKTPAIACTLFDQVAGLGGYPKSIYRFETGGCQTIECGCLGMSKSLFGLSAYTHNKLQSNCIAIHWFLMCSVRKTRIIIPGFPDVQARIVCGKYRDVGTWCSDVACRL